MPNGMYGGVRGEKKISPTRFFFNFFLKNALKSHLPNGYGAKGAERTSP